MEEIPMSGLAVILVVRALHVIAGVLWAGSMFVLAAVIVPIAIRHGAEGAGRWTAMMMRKAGPLGGISGLVTVASGIYLMVVLHGQDESASGLVLKAGAVAALLALVIGLFAGRSQGLKLAALSEAAAQGTPSADVKAQMATVGSRVVLTSRIVALLLLLSVISMGVFRYVSAIAAP
jgi:uncharacterized membrane protein